MDFGRPATGLKLGARALEHLRTEHVPEGQAAVLRSRILVTMADAQVELGRTAEADDLLDAALQQSATALPMVQASRGVLLARTGRLPEARQQLDAGVAALSQSGRPSANLVRALLWRGLLHLSEARLDAAQADCEVVAELGRSTGMDPAVAVATHNLGLVRWVSGDLPGALHEMALADEVAHEVRAGIRALDRARVLLAAGLLARGQGVRRPGGAGFRQPNGPRSIWPTPCWCRRRSTSSLGGPRRRGRRPGGPRATTPRPGTNAACWRPG